MNSLQKKACYRCEIGGWRFITVKEVPRAQLHARRCGEGELDARLYPISQPFRFLTLGVQFGKTLSTTSRLYNWSPSKTPDSLSLEKILFVKNP